MALVNGNLLDRKASLELQRHWLLGLPYVVGLGSVTISLQSIPQSGLHSKSLWVLHQQPAPIAKPCATLTSCPLRFHCPRSGRDSPKLRGDVDWREGSRQVSSEGPSAEQLLSTLLTGEVSVPETQSHPYHEEGAKAMVKPSPAWPRDSVSKRFAILPARPHLFELGAWHWVIRRTTVPRGLL